MNKSKATQHKRDIFKKTKHLDKEGKPIMAHVGTEIVRSAYCSEPNHKAKSPSTVFVGTNEHGWIFKCSGTDKTGPHYFTADAP